MDAIAHRLGRLHSGSPRRAAVVALDHTLAIGIAPGAEDMGARVREVAGARPDAVLLSPGQLRHSAADLASADAPRVVVRLDAYMGAAPAVVAEERTPLVGQPKAAARAGADALIVYLVLGADGGGRETFSDDLRRVAEATEAAHDVGLPMIVEVTAWGSGAVDGDMDQLAYGCRAAVELGADAVKTNYPGNAEQMGQLALCCAVPVYVLGGAAGATEGFDDVREAVTAGAAGAFVGRRVWQSDDPAGATRDLVEAVHGR